MATKQAKQPKRTRNTRQPLTRALVLQRAMALADAEGIDALTMRSLAGELGIEAMSLYHHVANKERILDGMIDIVFDEIGLPAAGLSWSAALRWRAISARRVLMQHRWAVGLMDSRTSMGAATMRHHDTMIGVLRAAGFSMSEVAKVSAVMDSYVFGFVLQERSLPGSSAEEIEAMTTAMLAQFPPDQYPNLRAFAVEHVLQPGFAFGNEFERGLDVVLDGLVAENVTRR